MNKPSTHSTRWWSALLVPLILSSVLALFILWGGHGAAETRSADPSPPSPPAPPYREASGDSRSPAISFIDSPSATCHRPRAGTNACYINWSYLYVSAGTDAYVISMTITIDDRLRAYHAGFFQDTMIIPAGMTTPGYRVDCGPPGSGGQQDWGQTYAYTLRARDSKGLSSANYGSVTCPADTVQLFMPILRRR